MTETNYLVCDAEAVPVDAETVPPGGWYGEDWIVVRAESAGDALAQAKAYDADQDQGSPGVLDHAGACEALDEARRREARSR